MKKKHDDSWDDGRKIADMNVDGMPWAASTMLRGKQRRLYEQDKSAAEPESHSENDPEPETLTKEETRSLAVTGMIAGLAIALVFVAAAALFIWFCTSVWFA